MSASVGVAGVGEGWPWAITQTQLPADAWMSHTKALGAA